MDEKLEKTINNMYLGILYDKTYKKHKFLSNMDTVEKIAEINKGQKDDFAKSVDIKKFMKTVLSSEKNHTQCDIDSEKERVLQPFEILSVYYDILKAESDEELFELLNKIILFRLPSNIPSLDNISEKFVRKDKNKLNILIAGGGPVGLFIANYLNVIYKNPESNIEVNILVLDNRVGEKNKDNSRLPFTRSRTFAIGTRFLDVVFPGIYCKKKSGTDSLLIPIKYLELLLYIKTYTANIPIFFTDKYKTFEDYQKLIKEFNVDIFFDASGGRIKDVKLKVPNDLLSIIDKQISRNMSDFEEYKDYKFKINKEDNLVEFDLKDKYNMWLSVEYIGKSPIHRLVDTYNITNKEDYELLNNVCIPKNKIKDILKDIKDENLKKQLIYLFQNKIQYDSDISSLKFFTFQIKMYHQIKASQWFNYKSHKFLYIGSGDTLFSSHFIRGAGLNRTLLFSLKVCHLFPFLIY